MKHLMTLICFIWATFVLLSLCVIGISSIAPSTNPIVGLALCDNVPCYQGIVPLKTTYAEAHIVIMHIPGVTWHINQSDTAFVPEGPIRLVHLFPSADQRIQEVDIRPRNDAITLGQVIAHLGAPCAVYPFKPSTMYPSLITLAYPTIGLWVETNHWRLDPNLPVKEIDLVPPVLQSIITSDQLISPCEGNNIVVKYQWQGFRQYPYQKP